MTSIIKADNISTVSGSGNINLNTNMTLPTGVKITGTDSASVIAPDMVIQCVTANGNQTNNASGSSWVTATGVEKTITTKQANSKLVVQLSIAVWRSDATGYIGVRAYGGPQGGSHSIVGLWGDGYISGANISWDTSYQHSYTAGAVGTYENYYQFHPNSGGSWFPNNAGTYGPTHRWSITIWEIAQ